MVSKGAWPFVDAAGAAIPPPYGSKFSAAAALFEDGAMVGHAVPWPPRGCERLFRDSDADQKLVYKCTALKTPLLRLCI